MGNMGISTPCFFESLDCHGGFDRSHLDFPIEYQIDRRPSRLTKLLILNLYHSMSITHYGKLVEYPVMFLTHRDLLRYPSLQTRPRPKPEAIEGKG